MLSELQGQLDRITYTNAETGYTVARINLLDSGKPVIVVGNFIAPTPGEMLALRGEWSNHPKYGDQFKVAESRTLVPATTDGIRKYLGSGLIKGIGKSTAARIVDRFGQNTLEIIENDIEKLTRVKGIGPRTVDKIKTAWVAQRQIRDVMIFLQGHGVGPGFAARIFARYGNDSIAVVQNNPYQLATDIAGIGFKIADKIASQTGFPKDDPRRALAGLLYLLDRFAEQGHVYYPRAGLSERACEMLGTGQEVVAAAETAACGSGKIVVEMTAADKPVYLSRLFRSENQVARQLTRLLQAPADSRVPDPDKALVWVQGQLALRLAPEQQTALSGVMQNKVMVMTGGPGTGKTTIIKAVLQIFSRSGTRTLLAAPTGRAAKRMQEATRGQAMTIHRLLEFSFQAGGFQKNRDNPLACDLLIIDEASMLDTVLAGHLLEAVPDGAALLLVGDVNQLPSVGPGNVLNDIIESGPVHVVVLSEIFRQARSSRIVVNAHRINKGQMPTDNSPEALTDFYFIEKHDPQVALETILELVSGRIPSRFNYDPLNDIQVLTPMHKGIAGAANLNRELQKRLNPGAAGVARGDLQYCVNDKVMQIKNNYDKDVFNGDIGIIARIDAPAETLHIRFDEREVGYGFGELDEIVLAYAISVHKSQGSEYPVVVMPVLTQHYILLQRNLIYTAITRARKLVVLVGTRKALAIGVGNNKVERRFSRLQQRLRVLAVDRTVSDARSVSSP
ncbi:MAG: ATP-dependent RecD-like DNA helicase [Desulfobacterales bacterium]|nr:ATP-dependent RecD-like DNA helicase [Desulfobacterales bacterium]